MRRRLLNGLALAFAVSNLGAFAQNTFPASGNVGIGTTSPTDALSVNGDIDIGARFKFDNPNAYGGSSAVFGLNGSSGNKRFVFYDYITALPLMSINDATAGGGVLIGTGYSPFSATPSTAPANGLAVQGNVGIGTTAPDKPLYVNGGIHLNMPGGINWSNNHSLLITNSVDTAAGDTGAQIWHGDGGTGGSHLLIFSSYPQTSAALTGGYMVLNTVSGNVGIGTTTPQAKLEVNGNVRFTADGSVQTTAWTGVLCGGDYAESVDVAGGRAQYGPGDVMVVDTTTSGGFAKSSAPYSTLVAGIYSTRPGVIGRRSTDPDKAKEEIPMAMIGIVPVKVSTENGPVSPGDLLVTSSTPGYAIKVTDREHLTGAVLGKALGSVTGNTGTIEVLASLQ